MKIFRFLTICAVAAISNNGYSHADIFSDTWTTGVSSPADGGFGTPGSMTGSTVNASIMSGASTANVSLTASNGSWFRTTGTSNGTNEELVPFLENDSPLTNLTFHSDKALHSYDILVHNVWHSVDGNQNFIGNFEVTYENGTVVSNATPTMRGLATDSPFDIDFLNGTTQPEGLGDAFDGYNLLTMSSPAFDPGNSAPLGTYLYDDSHSILSEQQGSAILSFDESAHGGITDVSFTWVGHTVGVNTGFIGFAGQVSSVPEPSCLVLLGLGGGLAAIRRRRTIQPGDTK